MKKIPPSEHFYDKTYLAAFVRLYIF